MLDKLLQALAITLLLSLLAGISQPKSSEPQRSIFHVLSVPPVHQSSLSL
jgi:hypothetical protein